HCRRSTQATSLVAAAVAVAVLAVGTRIWSAPSIGGPQASPTQTPSAEPSTRPSPSVVVNRALPVGGSPVYAGTYAFSAFQPALTFTIDKVVKLDCSAG